MSVGKGRRERNPGEAGAGADVSDPARRRELLDAETAEAVRDVNPPCLLGLTDRARRVPGCGEKRNELLQGRPPGGTQLTQARRQATKGATTTRRSGSSPSL